MRCFDTVCATQPHLVIAVGLCIRDGQFALVYRVIDYFLGIVYAAKNLMRPGIVRVCVEHCENACGRFVQGVTGKPLAEGDVDLAPFVGKTYFATVAPSPQSGAIRVESVSLPPSA